MIDYIVGAIAELTPAIVVLETNGVGYCVHITLPTYAALEGETETKIYIYELIREDAHTLYGFRSVQERQLFLLLISVSGIGANTARLIMSSFTASEIQEMIAAENVKALNSIKGVGLKTAQRIIIDLKDKVLKADVVGGFSPQVKHDHIERRDEALSALVMLGFNSAASLKIIDKIIKDDPSLKVEQIIKSALKML